MKKLFLLHTLLAILLFSAVGCSSSGDDGDTNPLVGFWHIATEESITSIRIDDNGTGEATIHTYTDDIWETSTRLLQYTLANDYLAVKIDGEDAICGRIAITGTSLSITQGDEIYMFTGYNGDEAKIKELQTHIEDNYTQNKNEGNEGDDDEIIILPPSSTVPEENLFQTEVSFRNALAATYMYIVSFEAAQLNLENIIITGKDMTGVPRSITATMPEIEECWTNAYKAINQCNTIIEYANEEYGKYADEAKALRCFLYYNIAHLWGQVPYITATNADVIKNSPIYRQNELYGIIYDEISLLLNDFENSRFGEYRIGASTLLALQAEIDLYFPAPSYGHAEKLLSQCHANFSLSVNEGQEDLYSIFGKEIVLYTPQYIEFLRQEAQVAGSLEELWSEINGSSYGYWAMLKRRGLAYKHYMPIPEKELMFNPNLTQNPGY